MKKVLLFVFSLILLSCPAESKDGEVENSGIQEDGTGKSEPVLELTEKDFAFTLDEGMTSFCEGQVFIGESPAVGEVVKAYKVVDLEERFLVLAEETRTDSDGAFYLDIPEKNLFYIQAGVSHNEWLSGKGAHGGVFIDFSLPEDPGAVEIVMTEDGEAQ